MFEARNVLIRNPGIKDRIRPCAVDLSQGLVFPFVKDFDVTDTVDKLNHGIFSTTDFIPEKIEKCYDAVTGAPFRPAVLDDAEVPTRIVNIGGVDYDVPVPVADYLETVRQGFAASCIRINTLEDEVAHFSGVQRN